MVGVGVGVSVPMAATVGAPLFGGAGGVWFGSVFNLQSLQARKRIDPGRSVPRLVRPTTLRRGAIAGKPFSAPRRNGYRWLISRGRRERPCGARDYGGRIPARHDGRSPGEIGFGWFVRCGRNTAGGGGFPRSGFLSTGKGRSVGRLCCRRGEAPAGQSVGRLCCRRGKAPAGQTVAQ